jgi:antitoxin ParD1/3/4
MVRRACRAALLEEHEIKLATLRDALIEGENSGSAAPLDVDEFLRVKGTAASE